MNTPTLCLLCALLLPGCALPPRFATDPAANVRTVKEFDRHGYLIGSWVVDVQTIHYEPDDSLTVPGVPHPLRRYEVRPGEER